MMERRVERPCAEAPEGFDRLLTIRDAGAPRRLWEALERALGAALGQAASSSATPSRSGMRFMTTSTVTSRSAAVRSTSQGTASA